MINVNWTSLILWLLPSPVRTAWMVNWLLALISPIMTIHAYLITLRRQARTEILTTGQVRILRAYLNSRFDLLLKRINIITLAAEEQKFIYLASENKPLYLPVFLTSGDGYDFIVEVPFDLMSYESDLKAIVNKFKLPTKKYYIIYI